MEYGTPGALEKYSLLYSSTTQAGTPASTDETTLASYTLPANKLATDGDFIEVRAIGSFAANTNTKRVKVKFGNTLLDSGAAGMNDYNWNIYAKIYRTAAATQDTEGIISASKNTNPGVNGIFASNDAVQQIGTLAETLSSSLIISITGQNGTSNANDIVLETFTVEHKKQNT